MKHIYVNVYVSCLYIYINAQKDTLNFKLNYYVKYYYLQQEQERLQFCT